MSDVGCGKPRALSYIRHPTSHIRHRAFTLIEATLSIAITSILLLGMGAALAMTMGAVDTGDDANARATQGAEQLSRLNAELSTATAITTFTPTDIAFTVPDRNKDGFPEQIEYTWPGVAGGTMFRSYNGSPPIAWLPAVQSCLLAYADRPAAVPVESAEQVLAQCDTVAGATPQWFSVDNQNFAAQYVQPALPAGTVSWKITRVRVYLKLNGGNSDPMYVRICSASAALKPTLPVLATAVFSASSLSSLGSWLEFAPGPVSGLAPRQGICIEIDAVGDNAAFRVAYLQGGVSQPYNTHFTTTSSTGSAWTPPNDTQDMRFVLMGTYTTLVEP